jgi:hypothetical protein
MTELEAEIVSEAGAIVEGRVVDQLWAHGQPIPTWAWLNALAHRPVGGIGDPVGVACHQPYVRWAEALVDIALDLAQITPVEATGVQAALFAPAELDALAARSPRDGPEQFPGQPDR